MNEYLDTDSVRRQANTILRLTVVTIFGLIGTVATGFLGMNLLAEAHRPLIWRILFFLVVLDRDQRHHDVHDREIEASRGFPRHTVRRARELAREVALAGPHLDRSTAIAD